MEAANRALKQRNLALARARTEVARSALLILAAIGVTCVVACGDDAPSVKRLPSMAAAQPVAAAASYKSSGEDLSPRLLRRFKPLAPLEDEQPQALVDLGRLLYFEPLMSRDGKVSCNSCHPLARYGATATSVSTGVDGRQGVRNAPSTYNAAGHFRQFWDGRSATSLEQVSSPIRSPFEMDMDETTLVGRLSDIEGYRRAFAQGFPGSTQPITLVNVAVAIAEFERGLRTPARWDLYLAGDGTVLTSEEKGGAKLFANLGCMVCHEGQYLGGSMFQRAGAVIPWPNQKDRGRRDITHDVADDMVFKVPSLRNVAKTAPYFHDGSVATLNEAVQMMARHQLGVSLTPGEADAIVTWMGSLTGTISADYVRAPELPAAIRP